LTPTHSQISVSTTAVVNGTLSARACHCGSSAMAALAAANSSIEGK
jgi:hypothetical protein